MIGQSLKRNEKRNEKGRVGTMRLMRQFGIIAAMTCIGELMHYFIPLPVPGSIYGLLLMLAALMTGIVKLEQVKETAEFLIDVMPRHVHSGRRGAS